MFSWVWLPHKFWSTPWAWFLYSSIWEEFESSFFLFPWPRERYLLVFKASCSTSVLLSILIILANELIRSINYHKLFIDQRCLLLSRPDIGFSLATLPVRFSAIASKVIYCLAFSCWSVLSGVSWPLFPKVMDFIEGGWEWPKESSLAFLTILLTLKPPSFDGLSTSLIEVALNTISFFSLSASTDYFLVGPLSLGRPMIFSL